jgi:hypothetical protein
MTAFSSETVADVCDGDWMDRTNTTKDTTAHRARMRSIAINSRIETWHSSYLERSIDAQVRSNSLRLHFEPMRQ